MDQSVAVGVDVGGTKLLVALVAADGSILDRVRHDTPRTARGIVDLITQGVRRVGDGRGLDDLPVGVGIAGLIDRTGVVRYAPNLPLADFGLADSLGETLGREVAVDNDGNVAAWGEYRLG
ncbi:MAG TPA: ROK family protein, partial [Egibacteraceae bacterium]|nr:ROK family protein [Egibacteraceae bacterium]